MDKSTLTEQLITEVLSGLRTTKGFVIDQAPDVVKQILYWNAASAAIWIVMSLVLGITIWRASIRISAELKKPEYEQTEAIAFGGTLGCIFSTILALVVFTVNIFILAKVLIAPKLYLIEYFSGLLTSK